MTFVTILLWAVQGLVLLVGVYFLYRVATHGRRVRASGAPGFAAVQPGALSGTWNAVVTDEGSHPSFSGRRGHVRVDNGWIGFHADGSPQPTWIVPASQVRGGRNTMFAMSEVWLESAQTGRINLTVSHEHINGFVDNDFKDMRERRYAHEFLLMLGRHGAHVAP
ncbi:hypothetical protein [Knoellia subterranea]|uniref:Uncharacterized protein n=1 Tax=Knoellia subterranea KCTC 19937 TaxID=1385521 RepID=A0A0A0JN38_9MICO|nr:hypothetical protein [Knoellia subterranea]KGN38865.1 hypothetical protein N803_07640 [Knoellia subterranea KCTC 19937]